MRTPCAWPAGKIRAVSPRSTRNSESMQRPTLPSVRALTTIPRADKDLLIFLASSKVWPEAPVLPTFSGIRDIDRLGTGYQSSARQSPCSSG